MILKTERSKEYLRIQHSTKWRRLCHWPNTWPVKLSTTKWKEMRMRYSETRPNYDFHLTGRKIQKTTCKGSLGLPVPSFSHTKKKMWRETRQWLLSKFASRAWTKWSPKRYWQRRLKIWIASSITQLKKAYKVARNSRMTDDLTKENRLQGASSSSKPLNSEWQKEKRLNR